jgi:hypothetical protein
MSISPKISRPASQRSLAQLAAVAGALACVGLVSACGSKSKTNSTSATTNVNTGQVARSIQQNILAQRHLASTVVCPPVVVAQAGKTFECVATTQSTKKPVHPIQTPFVVTIQNSHGGVTYVGK